MCKALQCDAGDHNRKEMVSIYQITHGVVHGSQRFDCRRLLCLGPFGKPKQRTSAIWEDGEVLEGADAAPAYFMLCCVVLQCLAYA